MNTYRTPLKNRDSKQNFKSHENLQDTAEKKTMSSNKRPLKNHDRLQTKHRTTMKF